MNAALVALDALSTLAFAAGLFYILRTPSDERSSFSVGAKAFLVAAGMVYVLVVLNDLAGRLHLATILQSFQDSVELLFIQLVLVAVYSLLGRQRLNDARSTYEGLLRTGDMMIRAIESTPAGTLWIDPEGHIAFANPAAREMLDLDTTALDEATGHPDWIVRIGSSASGRSSISPDFSKLVTKEPVVDMQVIVEWPSGWRRRFSVNTAPNLSPDGRIEGVIASFLDQEPWRVLQHRGSTGERRGQVAAGGVRDADSDEPEPDGDGGDA